MIALILGCAECVWDDALGALELCTPDAIFAVKDMMVKWPLRIDYGITLHPDRTDKYMRDRTVKGFKTGFPVWSYRNVGGTQVIHKTTNDWAGSSGLFAIKVAIKEGFETIILAGVPMDPKYGHVARRKEWPQATMFRNGWHHHINELKPVVRSMSGWTKEMFGAPTVEWLQQRSELTEPSYEMIAKLKALRLPTEHEMLST